MNTALIPDDPGSVIRAQKADADRYHLSYTLYRTDFTVGGGHAYSLAVTVESASGRETAFAGDITRKRSRALKLFALISRGLVTPCTLFDVLEDML